jgi:hypothetical protein
MFITFATIRISIGYWGLETHSSQYISMVTIYLDEKHPDGFVDLNQVRIRYEY